jgi:hypothetical protein
VFHKRLFDETRLFPLLEKRFYAYLFVSDTVSHKLVRRVIEYRKIRQRLLSYVLGHKQQTLPTIW